MRQGDPVLRRVKLVRIGGDELISLFIRPRIYSDEMGAVTYIRTVHFPGLPPDVQFITAHYDYNFADWAILLSHPSWPEIPQGKEIPRIESAESELMLVNDAVTRYRIEYGGCHAEGKQGREVLRGGQETGQVEGLGRRHLSSFNA